MNNDSFAFFRFKRNQDFPEFDRIGQYSCCQQEAYNRVWFQLRVDGRSCDCRLCKCTAFEISATEMRVEFKVNEDFSVISHWQLYPETGVVSRRDIFFNNSPAPCRVERFSSVFPFTCGNYEAFIQRGMWCGEAQGSWEELRCGTRELSCVSGRYSENCTPFMVIRDAYASRAVGFHLIPDGNWQIRLNSVIRSVTLPALHVETGTKSEFLAYTVPAGGSYSTPEVCIINHPDRHESGGTAIWHTHLLTHKVLPGKRFPILYNTWLYHYNFLDLDRMHRQLDAARKAGCEYFVVDYGWFVDNNYFLRIGKWTEKTDEAPFGKLADFADEVRSMGMKFGIWIESEFFHASTPEISEHPEWFEHCSGDTYRLKLELPGAAEYFKSTILEIINRYHPEYIKNDMNHSQEMDLSGTELTAYTAALQKLWSELRTAHPEIYWESCSSGAMRQTPESLNSFHSFFISDNADPVDNLYILQGELFNLPPGKILHWLVLSQGEHLTECRRFIDNRQILVPQYATWDNACVYDFDFAALSAMNGSIFGLSGDLATLGDAAMEHLRGYVDFIKQYRDSIARCRGYLLTPVETNSKFNTWAAFEYYDPEDDRHFIYVFHNTRFGEPAQAFPLHELEPANSYQVRKIFPAKTAETTLRSGRELLDDGLFATFQPHAQGGWRGQLWIVEKSVSE